MANPALLTQLAVDKVKARGERDNRPVGGVPGLVLRISKDGRKSYSLRYRLGDKQPRLTLGQHPVMTLAAAKDAAIAALEMASKGDDPVAAKADAARERDRNSVAGVAAEYVERHLKRNTRRWRDAEQMLKRDVLPALGSRPITLIKRHDVLDVVDAVVDRGSPVAANRVLTLIKRLLNWAVERGIVESNVAAGIKPPHRETPRERSLSETEIEAVWQAFDQMAYPFGVLGKLLLLTGQRRGEVACLKWADLDLGKGVLRLAGTATKTGVEHLLPLSGAAVEVLHSLPRVGDSPLVFPASRAGTANAVSGFSKALLTAHRLSGTSGWHWHDARRTCATGMARLDVAPHVVERILNHGGGSTMSVIARTYNVHSYQVEMRQALELWAAEVERIISGGETKVVALRVG